MARLLRNAINSVVTNWMANAPGINTAFKYLYTVALLGDCLLEQAWEGFLAALPGVGTPTANPLIAQSRGLLQGPNEPDASFIDRLIAFLVAWEQAGSAEILAQQIQSYLCGQGILGAGVYPIVRVVDRNGNWAIANADQSTTFVSAPWDWDEVTGADDGKMAQPPVVLETWWADMWIVVAPPSGSTPIYAYYTGTSDVHWLANFGPNAKLGGGHQVPLSVSNAIIGLIATWKGEHSWFRAVIWATDSTSFSPSTPTADGTYGNWCKNVGGVMTPGRSSSARYWIPAAGG